jgi:hypothetical protein
MRGRLWCGLLCLLIAADVQAAEPTVITLSCDGTVRTDVGKDKGPREAISKVGVVVNLVEHTVSFTGFVAQIDYADIAVIEFSRNDPKTLKGFNSTTSGYIDRVTGAMNATTFEETTRMNYDLLCKPASRVF